MRPSFSWLNVINPVYWIGFIWYLGSKAREKTYHGLWPGIVTHPLGLAFSVAALITTYNFVGTVNGWNWFVASLSAGISALIVEGFLWPFAFVVSDKLGEGLGWLTERLAKHVLPGILDGLKRLPGSSLLWSKAEDDKAKKWFTVFIMGLSYAAGFLGSLYLGGQTALWVKGLVGDVFASGWAAAHMPGYGFLASVPVLSWIASFLNSGYVGALLGAGWILGGFGGFVVFRLLVQPVFDVMEHGKLPGVAVIAGALSGYSVWTLFGGGLAVASIAAGLGSFLVVSAWLFPLLLLLFNEGLKKFGEWIKPLLKKVYSADESDWRLLFHHIVNVLVTAGLTIGAYLLGSSLDWYLPITLVFAVFAALVSYFSVIRMIRHDGGNAIIGFLTSLAAALGSYNLYTAYVGFLGWLGGVIAAAFGALLCGLLVLPGLYRLLEIALAEVTAGAGKRVDDKHKAAFEWVKNFHKNTFERAQKETFEDKTDFKAFFGQIANILFAAAVFYAGWAYGVSQLTSTIAWWAALVGLGLLTLISYIIGGYWAKHDGGEPLIAMLSIGAALYVGANAFVVLPWTWWLALPTAIVLAILAGCLVGFYVLPPVYWILKKLVGFIPDTDGGWKKSFSGVLESVHKTVYEAADRWIWSRFKRVVERIAKFMAPIIAAIDKRWRALMDRIDRIFNKKRRAS